jgi:hypothetical protein
MQHPEGFVMTQRVSQSHTGQNEPKPSRQERDAASSSGAGRKAVEDTKDEVLRSKSGTQARGPELAPPIGTDLETKADEV